MSSGLQECAEPLDSAYDVALLDLDGVVYVGEHAVPGAPEAIAAAQTRFAYVTNNASRTPAVVAGHLRDLGIPARDDEVVTSSQAAARLMAAAVPAGSRVLAVGGPGVAESLASAGLVPVSSEAPLPVAGVMQGFGRDVGWSDLAQASLAVREGAYWVATNPDRTFPIPGGLAPGNGMMVAAVAEASGRQPDAIAGKPFPALTEESVLRSGAQRPIVVGDRLDTDIEGARRLGIASLLVMTGVTDVGTLLLAPSDQRPDYLGMDLGALLVTHPAPRPTSESTWQCGESSARLVGDSLEVSIAGWLDALRCACAAMWSSKGPVDLAEAVRRLEAARPSSTGG
ncbi:MAG: HAD-IIA family hydrolase [Candidatus Nanopelagicales bacterium]